MANIKLFGIKISIFIVITIIVDGFIYITQIFSKAGLSLNDDDQAIQGNVSVLQDSMDIFYLDLYSELENGSTKDTEGFNIPIVTPMLKYTEGLENIFFSLGAILYTSFSDFPRWFMWAILAIISFVILWKLLEAWLGREA